MCKTTRLLTLTLTLLPKVPLSVTLDILCYRYAGASPHSSPHLLPYGHHLTSVFCKTLGGRTGPFWPFSSFSLCFRWPLGCHHPLQCLPPPIPLWNENYHIKVFVHSISTVSLSFSVACEIIYCIIDSLN